MKNKFKVLCGAVALVAAGQVSAGVDFTWGLNSTSLPGGVSGITGLSNTGGSQVTPNADTQTIQTAVWTGQSGVGYGGISNADSPKKNFWDGSKWTKICDIADCDTREGSSPEHAIDNDERYDMALLSFVASVKLTGFTISWSNTDSDMTVLAYTGAGAPTLIGKTWGDLAKTGSDWTLIGNYADVSTGSLKSTNNTNVFSSYWLIGAYNPLAGKSEGWSLGNDYVKLASVTGCVTGSRTDCTPPPLGKVPEPNSLILFGLGLLGMIGLRRRQSVRF